MITLEQKNSNEIKFIELLSKLGIDLTELTKFLDKIDYFNAPATSQYSGAYPGGLCEYALKVAHELGALCNAYFPGRYTEEDVIKVALFKDLYRATLYETYLKNTKNPENGQWVYVPTYRTKEGTNRPVFGDIGFSSYMQIKNLVPLTDEQIEAIIHSGASEYVPDIHDISRAYPLVALTKMADMAARYF